MRLILLVLSYSIFSIAFAGNADTIAVYSNSMKKDIKTVVITPNKYGKKKKKFPVVYLLHGYGGSYHNWVNRVPDLKELADKNQLIIVCPDGAIGSWYFDSPIDSTYRYETFVGKELPIYIDSKYKTIRDRKARAITGLSMGGHGGMFLGFRHAETFGACGSMSGALDVSLITRGYDMQKRLGDTVLNKKYYQEWSVMKVMEQYPKDSLAIIIDCGTEDFIYGMSKAAHEKMMKLKIQHDYIERPGKHDWKYWDKAVRYQLLFFKEFFEKGRR
jgi:S-formylglutathione hydrolase FrmB